MKASEATAIGVGATVLGVMLIYVTAHPPQREPVSAESITGIPALLPATASATAPANPPPPVAAAPAVPQTNGPITYYVMNCARCHGDISSAYVDVTRPKRGDALKQVIADMATGPADAPLDEAGLSEQVRLHEAMFDHKPYAWTDPAIKNLYAGEQLDNTKVTLTVGDLLRDPGTDGYRFAFNSREGILHVRSK